MGINQETKCRVAVIGAGNMAREHVRAFMDVAGCQVVGLYSRTRSRAEALAGEFAIPGVYDSVPELYEQTRADLVVVTVIETAMNAVSRACFEFPWTVLLEKPPGYNVPDAEEIRRAAVEKKRNVLVALNRRFYSSTRATLGDLAEDDGPRFIQVQDQQDLEEAAGYGLDDIVLANLMYANSIHLIDYLCLFGRGKITSVTPVIRWNPKAHHAVVALVAFESGDQALYTGIWKGPGPWAVTVNTPQRRWEMRPLEQLAYQNRGERRLNTVEMHEWDREFKPGFRLQAEMAVASAKGGASESVTLDEAMRTMYLIEKIFD